MKVEETLQLKKRGASTRNKSSTKVIAANPKSKTGKKLKMEIEEIPEPEPNDCKQDEPSEKPVKISKKVAKSRATSTTAKKAKKGAKAKGRKAVKAK